MRDGWVTVSVISGIPESLHVHTTDPFTFIFNDIASECNSQGFRYVLLERMLHLANGYIRVPFNDAVDFFEKVKTYFVAVVFYAGPPPRNFC